MVPAPGAGAPAMPEPTVAEKQPPAPARKNIARASPKAHAATAEVIAEFPILARWRKMMEQRKGAVITTSYPGNDNGGH
jgi:hypothetical protein